MRAATRCSMRISRHVKPEIAAAVGKAKLTGVYVAQEPRRWYPGREIAGPVIGRADIDGNGLDGIELSMNDLLRGTRGAATALRDARGRKMLAGELAPAEPGARVRLTLDRSIQAIADEALAETVIAKQAKNGVVVVIDVPTGKVLAMSSYPTFDPNGENVHGARNRPVTDAYEAGSVMKIFTVAAALEEGVVKPSTGFVTGTGFRVIGRPRPITDVHPEPYLTVSDIIKVSSNIGAAKIALRLGSEKTYAYFKKFGFGSETGIELPGETTGKMRAWSTWRDSELATMAFGYGLTVTPLQIAAGLAAIGNRGVYHAPRIVEQVVDADGNVVYRGNAEAKQMISAAPLPTSTCPASAAAARPAPRTSTIRRSSGTPTTTTCRRSPASRRSIIPGSRSSCSSTIRWAATTTAASSPARSSRRSRAKRCATSACRARRSFRSVPTASR